mmetsp:Transcript_59017/g.188511  ORF Transcript_59017/g.188511 Transcript_59017/m.188511 type:complete len:338 (-) Transcript_59017:103-1116(-)|eukprot:CAMPEP_0182866338 /NCGR_PEP_ID=MMETSP0034_2-20130328/8154_1 /TAXON_ID=156128 /ORGANISM="Nephroselmis pyriformis, Strain CCMP717" /LENGTH=337 /DNA_ID=CAMNT_0024998665 /DNA_START=330 /DNA_END=1343 /DNA_ORIENTATION=+
MGCGVSSQANGQNRPGGMPPSPRSPIARGRSPSSPLSRSNSRRLWSNEDLSGETLRSSITEAENVALASALRVAQNEVNKLQKENNELRSISPREERPGPEYEFSLSLTDNLSPRPIGPEDIGKASGPGGHLQWDTVGGSSAGIKELVPPSTSSGPESSAGLNVCLAEGLDVVEGSVVGICGAQPLMDLAAPPPEDCVDVVICCSSPDGLREACALEAQLSEGGLRTARVFHGSHTGEDARALESAVMGCRVGVVVVLSPSALRSEACVLGLRAGAGHGRPLALVYLADATCPDITRLPQDLRAPLSREAVTWAESDPGGCAIKVAEVLDRSEPTGV